MTNTPTTHRWKPLADLPAGWRAVASAQLAVLSSFWTARSRDLRNTESLREFHERLARRWAIETGIVEGVYRIDRGTTELLIERGIESVYIPHGSTDRPAEEIVRVLQDHRDALEGLFAFVSGERELSISYIRELHQQLCANQETVTGRDALGNLTQRGLRKGEWKRLPNNPHRCDGSVHEYCPPEHVDSEMESLVSLHRQHRKQGVPPDVEAAWLHHRFTQVHPFEDGNGRVARALATLVLLRAGLFPFVLDREKHASCIEALEIADREDDLLPLTALISSQQQQTLLDAIDLAAQSIRRSPLRATLDKVLADATARVREKALAREETDRHLLEARVEELLRITRDRLEESAVRLKEGMGELEGVYKFSIEASGEAGRGAFGFMISDAARQLGYTADTEGFQKWVRLLIERGSRGWQIVFSFHQHERSFTGIFMGAAFFSMGDTATILQHGISWPTLHEGFAVVPTEEDEAMVARYREWLDAAIASGIESWVEHT